MKKKKTNHTFAMESAQHPRHAQTCVALIDQFDAIALSFPPVIDDKVPCPSTTPMEGVELALTVRVPATLRTQQLRDARACQALLDQFNAVALSISHVMQDKVPGTSQCVGCHCDNLDVPNTTNWQRVCNEWVFWSTERLHEFAITVDKQLEQVEVKVEVEVELELEESENEMELHVDEQFGLPFVGYTSVLACLAHLKAVESIASTLFHGCGACTTAIFNDAVEHGNALVVEILLQDSRVDPSAHENEAIRTAAYHGHLAVVEVLLGDIRVDPSVHENDAIRMAAQQGDVDTVSALLCDVRVNPAAQARDVQLGTVRKIEREKMKVLLTQHDHKALHIDSFIQRAAFYMTALNFIV